MMRKAVPLTRRRLIGASLVAGGLVAARVSPALAALGVATPPQTMGPFFPREKPLDVDNDLTRIGSDGILKTASNRKEKYCANHCKKHPR